MSAHAEPVRIDAGALALDALLLRPARMHALYVLAHGAGAGMRHPFLQAVAAGLALRGVGTLRFDFPYITAGSRRPDPAPRLEAAVGAALEHGARLAGAVDVLIAGGKSMGGRMTSRALSKRAFPRLHGLVFLGFPLHAPGKPGRERADHLEQVDLPMLFLQGTRDTLADSERMRDVCGDLGARASLHEVDGADHGFHVLKRSGRTDPQVLDELVDAIVRWLPAP